MFSLLHHNGQAFSTKDRDNDEYKTSCAWEPGGTKLATIPTSTDAGEARTLPKASSGIRLQATTTLPLSLRSKLEHAFDSQIEVTEHMAFVTDILNFLRSYFVTAATFFYVHVSLVVTVHKGASLWRPALNCL